MAFLELGSPSKIPREAVLAQIPKTMPHKEHIKQLCEHLESLCYGALSGPTIQAVINSSLVLLAKLGGYSHCPLHQPQRQTP